MRYNKLFYTQHIAPIGTDIPCAYPKCARRSRHARYTQHQHRTPAHHTLHQRCRTIAPHRYFRTPIVVLTVLLLLWLTIIPHTIEAWDWPHNSAQLTHSFLDYYAGQRSRGVIVTTPPNTPLSALHNGTYVFAAPDVSAPSPLRTPHVLGGFVITEHGQYRAVLTQVNPAPHGTTAIPDPIATSPAQPSDAQHIGIMVIDSDSYAYINPVTLLPLGSDEVVPSIIEYHPVSVITRAARHSTDHTIFTQSNPPTVNQPFNLELSTYDRHIFFGGRLILPFYMQVQYGEQVQTYHLRYLREDNGYLQISGTNHSIDDLFIDQYTLLLGAFIYDATDTISFTIIDYHNNTKILTGALLDEE